MSAMVIQQVIAMSVVKCRGTRVFGPQRDLSLVAKELGVAVVGKRLAPSRCAALEATAIRQPSVELGSNSWKLKRSTVLDSQTNEVALG